MKAAQLEREIQVVETILCQLNKCLAIYYKQKLYDEFRVTIKDIQTVKEELKRLIAAKEAEIEAEKGAATNAAVERSGTSIS